MNEDKEMSTVIDRVLDFIQRKGRTTVTEVAISLAVSPSQIEHLVSILEESGMITVKYALIDSGKTELISKQQVEMKGDDLERLRAEVERIKSLGTMINKDIEKFEGDYKAIERDVSQWMVEAEGTLNSLKERSVDPGSIKQADEIEKIAKDFESRISVSDQRVIGDVKTMQDRFRAFHKRVSDLKTAIPGKGKGVAPPTNAGGGRGFSIGGIFGKKS